MTWTKTKGLQLNGVVFVSSAFFFCTLHQLAFGVSLYDSLPMSHIKNEFGKDSAEGVEKAEVDTGRVEEPVTHLMDHSDPASSEKFMKDKTSDFKTATEAALLPNISLPPAAETPFPEKVPHVASEFPKDLFSLTERRQGWVILHIIGFIYLFVALAVVCNEFFVPAVAVMTEKLSISDDVAGATIMAAGRSVPKFLAFLIGVLLAHSRVGIGSVVGSAVYNILFVTGMCALLAQKILHLNWWPFFRDVSFFIVHLIFFIIFFLDNAVMWWESLMLLGCYILYIVFLKFDEQIERLFRTWLYKHKRIEKVFTVEQDTVDVPAGLHKSGVSEDTDGDVKKHHSFRKNAAGEMRERDEERKEKPLSLKWPDTRYEQAVYILLLPVVFSLWLTIPDVRNQKSRKFFMVTFLVSILWIIVISYFTLWVGKQVGETLAIPHPMIGILIGGLSTPDLITSVIVARKGLGDMAVSSSVGSNIFDITVGLPVSWLLYSSIKGSVSVAVSSNGLICASVLLFLMLLLVIILIPSSKWRMNKVLGFTMVMLYIIFLVISMMMQYSIIVCPVGVGDGL